MIDTDVFQILVLVLLAVAVAVGVALLVALNQLRRLIGTQGGGQATSSYPEPSYSEPSYAAAAEPAATSHPLDTASAVPGYAGGAAAAGATTTAATSEPAAASYSAPESEPQEQPFEREGRWWFRRGDELLVYDEAEAQWKPATAAPPAGAGPATATAEQPAATGTATVEPAQQANAMWKCPSCGAVNGSTATSCRMCFTPRP